MLSWSESFLCRRERDLRRHNSAFLSAPGEEEEDEEEEWKKKNKEKKKEKEKEKEKEKKKKKKKKKGKKLTKERRGL